MTVALQLSEIVVVPDEALAARLDAALDALQALVRGIEIDDGKNKIKYARCIDDTAYSTPEQQRSIALAKAVLVEAGR